MPARLSVLSLISCAAMVATGQDLCIPIAALEPVDSWQTVSGSYGADGWAIYEMTMNLGVNYEFKTGCGDGATADHNTIIEWMTPVCTVIMADNDGCEEGRSRLSFESFFSDGITLWIRVRDPQGPGGSFTMAYRSIGGVPGECNECPSYDEQLSPSSLWETASGAYGSAGCHVYRIPVVAGMTYDVKTGCGNGASADHDTRLEVFNPGCAAIAFDDDACELGRSSVVWTAPVNGTAYVKVSSSDGEGGAFSMAYRRTGGNGSACGSCTVHDFSITPGGNWGTSHSSYQAGGCQIYRVSVTQGYQYTFKTGCGDGASADHDTRLELFNPACAPIAEDDNGCGAGADIIEYIAPASGFLYLRVSGSGGAEGFYTLAYRRSGTCTACPGFDAEVTPGPDWQVSVGNYLIHGCWLYKAHVTEGRTYVFQTQCGNGASADHPLTLSLFDEDCIPLQADYSGCNDLGERLFFHADSTGAVYLKVAGIDDYFGAHALASKELGTAADACADAPIIQFGEGTLTLSGSVLDATADGGFVSDSPWHGLPMKWYAIDLEAPCATFTVSYCGLSPAWPSTLGLLAIDCPADAVVTGAPSLLPCGNGNAAYDFTALPSGLYHLPVLLDPANPGDGSYTITLACSNWVEGGFAEGVSAGWRLHPNPGGTEFWLSGTTLPSAAAYVVVGDAMGREVLRVRPVAWPARVDASALASGSYVISIVQASSTKALLWLKE